MTFASGAKLRWVALVAASAFVLLALPAGAAEPDSTIARQRYLAGAQAYAAGKYADAVDQFIAADRIAPSAALSFDIARSYEKLGESSLALRWFRDYLHRTNDPPDGAKVRRIVQSLERELRDKGVQQVTVRSTPRGATVAIDGDPAGVTPWTGDLPPGRHRLALVYDGYERSERWLVLPPEHALDVDVHLARAEPKAAAVVATPAGIPAAPRTAPPAATPVSAPNPAEKAVPSAATAPVSSPEPSSSGSSAVRTIGIVTMGVGGAALGGALTFELLRRQAESDAKKDPTQAGYASKLDQANERQMAARVLLGVGAGLVVTGGVMFFVGGPSSEHRTEIAMGCGPIQCGATASGRF
jgi:hypothetical protein